MSRSRAAGALLVLLRWSLGAALIGAGVVIGSVTAAGLVPLAAGVALIGTPCAVRIARMDVYEPGGLAATSRMLAAVALPGLLLVAASLLVVSRL
jgi:hypothetical protein